MRYYKRIKILVVLVVVSFLTSACGRISVESDI